MSVFYSLTEWWVCLLMLLFTQYKTTWFTAVSSVTVSLHHLPRCLCSTVTCRAQWFQINPENAPKNYICTKKTETLCYEQKHMSVPVWIETTIEYWFNYSSTSKIFSAAQTFNIWTQLEDLSVVQDVFHNAGNILRWWYLSLIVAVHLLFTRKFCAIVNCSGI